MLNMNLRGMEDLKLEILSMNVKRNSKCKYEHEYICIDVRTYIRYKVEFITNTVNLDLTKVEFGSGRDAYISRNEVELNGGFLVEFKDSENIFAITELEN